MFLNRSLYSLAAWLASTSGQPPVGELQSCCPAHAEFVMCDLTIEDDHTCPKGADLASHLRLSYKGKNQASRHGEISRAAGVADGIAATLRTGSIPVHRTLCYEGAAGGLHHHRHFVAHKAIADAVEMLENGRSDIHC